MLLRRFLHGRAVYPTKESLKNLRLQDYGPEDIRNFSIISHIDHGKSTLATKILETTGTLRTRDQLSDDTFTDTLAVEKARGITVKANAVSAFISLDAFPGRRYMLNLIDTPGHVDFSYEVTRSLKACQGALLVVDATQGVQAQTIANFHLAFEQGLAILPVLNKIDMANARPEACKASLREIFGFREEEVMCVSGKTGENVPALLEAVIRELPAPQAGQAGEAARFLLFDTVYDQYRGVVFTVHVLDGKISAGDTITSLASGKALQVEQVGVFFPDRVPTEGIYAGQVGYVIAGLRALREAHIGDTFVSSDPTASLGPVAGFREPQPAVYAGIYPDGGSVEQLRAGLERLLLTDASVSYTPEHSPALGMGYRCGFLGSLHMDVFLQRLEGEQGIPVVATTPTVPFKYTSHRGDIEISALESLEHPGALPDDRRVRVFEPIARVRIILPREYVHNMHRMCRERRGERVSEEAVDAERFLLEYELPLCEIVGDFSDRVKALTSGYASLESQFLRYNESQMVCVRVALNGDVADTLAAIVHNSKAPAFGRMLTSHLKQHVKRQLFPVAIQATVMGKVIARETVPGVRKDVTAKLYGGDVTRKMKLLAKQKAGRKRLAARTNIDIPAQAYRTMPRS